MFRDLYCKIIVELYSLGIIYYSIIFKRYQFSPFHLQIQFLSKSQLCVCLCLSCQANDSKIYVGGARANNRQDTLEMQG